MSTPSPTKQHFKVITAHSPAEYESILAKYSAVSRIWIISTNIDHGTIIATIVVYPSKAGFVRTLVPTTTPKSQHSSSPLVDFAEMQDTDLSSPS